MARIAPHPLFLKILVAVVVSSMVAGATNLETRSIVKITLPHPCNIVPYLCSPRARSLSPVGSLSSDVDDTMNAGDKIFTKNLHLLAHSESLALSQPFHVDGGGAVRTTDNFTTITSHEGRPRDETTNVDGENIMLDVGVMAAEDNSGAGLGNDSWYQDMLDEPTDDFPISTSPDARALSITNAGAIVATTTTTTTTTTTVATAVAVANPRNNHAHRASPPSSMGPILSGPEMRLRVTAQGPPEVPARHASTSTDATPMATADVLRPWQVQKQVAQRILPLPAPRKAESSAARKQRRETKKTSLVADVAGASAADASAPILVEPPLHPSLLESTHRHRHGSRTHQSAGALKRKAARAERFGPLSAAAPSLLADVGSSLPDDDPDDLPPAGSPTLASPDLPDPDLPDLPSDQGPHLSAPAPLSLLAPPPPPIPMCRLSATPMAPHGSLPARAHSFPEWGHGL